MTKYLVMAAAALVAGCAQPRPAEPAPATPATEGAERVEAPPPPDDDGPRADEFLPIEAALAADVGDETPRLLRLTFLDVGQGDAILIQIDDVDILIDGGPALGWDRSIRQARNRIRGDLEFFFVTPPHDDHFHGATRLFDEVRVRHVITNGERRGPPRDDHVLTRWGDFVEAVEAAGLELDHVDVDDVLELAEGVALRVLATGSPNGGEFPDTSHGTDINNDSLVMMLEYGGRRVLLTGDMENGAQRRLVDQHCDGGSFPCEALRADVLKVPHHGSAHSESDFFRAVGTQLAVISADYNNRNGRHCLPRVNIVEQLHDLGAEVLSTSAEGTDPVIVWIGDDGSIARRAPPTVFAWDTSTSPCSGQTLGRQP